MSFFLFYFYWNHFGRVKELKNQYAKNNKPWDEDVMLGHYLYTGLVYPFNGISTPCGLFSTKSLFIWKHLTNHNSIINDSLHFFNYFSFWLGSLVFKPLHNFISSFSIQIIWIQLKVFKRPDLTFTILLNNNLFAKLYGFTYS